MNPILEYGSATFHPLNSTLIKQLEATQCFACCVILQSLNIYHEDLQLVQDSNLPPLNKHHDDPITIVSRDYSPMLIIISPNFQKFWKNIP